MAHAIKPSFPSDRFDFGSESVPLENCFREISEKSSVVWKGFRSFFTMTTTILETASYSGVAGR